MMALSLPSCARLARARQGSISLQQNTHAFNRRSSSNRSLVWGAVHLRVLQKHQGKSSNSLQSHTAWRSVQYRLFGGRQQSRALTGSNDAAPLAETEEHLKEQDVVDVVASPGFDGSTKIVSRTTQLPPEAPVRQQSQKTGGGGLQWILGPLALLVTGGLPALWLSLPALFNGSPAAGLLALTGLDTTFIIGANAFHFIDHRQLCSEEPIWMS